MHDQAIAVKGVTTWVQPILEGYLGESTATRYLGSIWQDDPSYSPQTQRPAV